jgi:adenosine deaminase
VSYKPLFAIILAVCISSCSSTAQLSNLPASNASTDSTKYDWAAQTGKYLESIQSKEVFLRQFFAEMPKGGDLHNHLTGSVYAETYYDIACMDSLYVDTLSGRLYSKKDTSSIHIIRLLPDYINSRHMLKVKLVDQWSIRNFHSYNRNIPQDEHFFNAFGLFGAATGNHMVALINELKQRALHENVQYLEIMGTSPSVSDKKMDSIFNTENYYKNTNKKLLDAIQSADTARIRSVIDSTIKTWEQNIAWKNEGIVYGKFIDSLDASSIADTNLVTRYLAYASRKSEPLTVLAQLHIGFVASNKAASKVVGVNIVSAENSEISMLHYTTHMLMFAVLKEKYPQVKASLHAGELTLGLVKPEDLGRHISQAVYIAKADRIGHGLDVAFERSSASLLKYMQENFIPVEINLTSNEFILGVKDNEHPLPLYVKTKVPLVISTDDAGILRTNLAEQYVLLVRRYGLEYSQIKQLVCNSIKYSFLKENEKQRLMEKLEREFETFEKNITNNY